MDVDLIDMGSLSLTDNGYWSRDQPEKFESEMIETVSDVARNQDSVIGYDNIVTSRPVAYHVLMMQADVSMMNANCVSGSGESYFSSIDEGYNSKSMSLTGGRPVQVTDNNKFQTSTCMSSDVVSVYSQNADGDTDLHLGIIQFETSLVETFIRMAPGSEWLNVCNYRLQTPLHLAVITEQPQIARRLMVAGARVDVSDIHGNTPLHIACREGYRDIVDQLLRPVYYEETLINRYEIPYQKIPQDLNKRNGDGLTCLHLAASRTDLPVMELLLSKGAGINVRDATSGRTVLHYAAETGNRTLLHFLLSQRHLDVCSETYGGLTPLRLAAGRGYDDIVGLLLMHGAADVKDDDETDDSGDDT